MWRDVDDDPIILSKELEMDRAPDPCMDIITSSKATHLVLPAFPNIAEESGQKDTVMITAIMCPTTQLPISQQAATMLHSSFQERNRKTTSHQHTDKYSHGLITCMDKLRLGSRIISRSLSINKDIMSDNSENSISGNVDTKVTLIHTRNVYAGCKKDKIYQSSHSGIAEQYSQRNHRLPYDLIMNYQDEDGDTELMLAVIKEATAYCVFLIDTTCEQGNAYVLDLQNHFMQTALHLAVITKQVDLVRYLIEAGASCDLQDHHGNTPLHIACREGLLDIVKLILCPYIGAKSNQIKQQSDGILCVRNYTGFTCLHLATLSSNLHIIEYLLSDGIKANVNEQEGSNGRTLLHLAVQNRDISLVIFLIRRSDVNIDALTFDGHPPLRLAAGLQCTEIVTLLISAGADYRLMHHNRQEYEMMEEE